MDIYEEISNSLLIGNAEKTDSLVREALGKMYPAEMILEQGLVGGIKKMEEKFQSMSMFVPEALMSARALNIGLENLRPYLKRKNGYKCTAILGTVEGDYHDIGKNLVKIYISTLEIKVIDLGPISRPTGSRNPAKCSSREVSPTVTFASIQIMSPAGAAAISARQST